MVYTEEEYQQLLRNLGRDVPRIHKKSKYNSRKIKADGITFDSQKEAEFYQSLKLLKKAGAIDGFCMQARFVITEGDETHRGAEYVTDFIIFYPDKTYRIVDVKGMETEVFKLKMKNFREKYPKLNIELEK